MKKFIIPIILLILGLAYQANKEPKLSGLKQADYETALIADVNAFQAQELSSRGKYKFKPKQAITAEYPTNFRVDEWVKGRNESKGYTIYIEHYESESVFSATTSQMELVPVLKRTIIQR